jgi:carbamate kinase
MGDAIVILVNGEVLADWHGATIPDQRQNSKTLAEGLMPILASELQVTILHGNKPQVGFVLLRSEIASHALHPIPLDVCGADTEGATGYMLSQAFQNALQRKGHQRNVISLVTQTLVDSEHKMFHEPIKTIGPWFNREKAARYREINKWTVVEEQGRGYRRAVPSPPAVKILEIDAIRRLSQMGFIVIAAGGGGIPVIRDEQGDLVGIEAVVETERVASMIAQELEAKTLLMIIESDIKFIRSRLMLNKATFLSLDELNALLQGDQLESNSVRRKLKAGKDFLDSGGEQVIITTLQYLPATLEKHSGLIIGRPESSLELLNTSEGEE